MIKITKWRPDTCGCEIEYEWDDAVSEDQRVHMVSRIVKVCPAHTGEPDKSKHFQKVLDENQMKNKVLSRILENIPNVVDSVTQEDGTAVKKLKPGKEYKWSFDPQRNLVIDLVGFGIADKAALKTITDTEFLGKVKIK